METDEKILTADIRSRLSDERFRHSLNVAASAVELAGKYGGDEKKAYYAGLMHDVLKELPKEEALSFFKRHSVELSDVEISAPKLWHAMTGSIYLKEKYDFPDDICMAVRYHTTGRTGMTTLEKIIFTADFISADRDYNGVDDMRERAKISLESAMEEGLRFTVEELAHLKGPIHPDTLFAYNEIHLQKKKGQ